MTIKNFYGLMDGILTPVQIEGLRLLLTPFPQEEFNPTEDRKSAEPSLGVTCLDCHVNGHTNAAFHLTPDVRPQAARFRLDTVSLRGVFNQQIHGSKRSLRSVEDFTEFEQRTAYFNGDHVSAHAQGRQPARIASDQVAMMAQMQNMIDFPPAPKLDPMGRLDPSKATQAGAGRRARVLRQGAVWRVPPAARRSSTTRCTTCSSSASTRSARRSMGCVMLPDGPIKTFTLRGIKDSPPYLHDGRLLTLEDTVEFFNLVLGLKLTDEEKQNLVAFMLTL